MDFTTTHREAWIWLSAKLAWDDAAWKTKFSTRSFDVRSTGTTASAGHEKSRCMTVATVCLASFRQQALIGFMLCMRSTFAAPAYSATARSREDSLNVDKYLLEEGGTNRGS